MLTNDGSKLINEPEDLTQSEEHKQRGFQRVVVHRIVDGDTFELFNRKRVRLIGVNTPESTYKTERYGQEARFYTTRILAGRDVWLQKDVSDTDQYGRLLRLVWVELPVDESIESEIRSKLFNADLVLHGYAEPSTFPPDVKFSGYFRKFAREARNLQLGLWRESRKGTTRGDFD
ncbi:MAG: thermonuclease family protein [Bacillota bacterium]